MKKIITSSALCIALVISASAQDTNRFIEKGTGLISLDVPMQMSFSNSKQQPGKNNTQVFGIGPHVSGGYFVTRHFMIGASLGMQTGFARVSNSPGLVHKHTAPIYLNANLMMRFYHLFTPKVGFFTQLLAGPTIQMNQYPLNDAGNGNIGVNVNWGPRIVILPTRNIGVNIGFGEFGYQYMANRINGNKISDVHNFSLLPNLNIGASMFLGRK